MPDNWTQPSDWRGQLPPAPETERFPAYNPYTPRPVLAPPRQEKHLQIAPVPGPRAAWPDLPLTRVALVAFTVAAICVSLALIVISARLAVMAWTG